MNNQKVLVRNTFEIESLAKNILSDYNGRSLKSDNDKARLYFARNKINSNFPSNFFKNLNFCSIKNDSFCNLSDFLHLNHSEILCQTVADSVKNMNQKVDRIGRNYNYISDNVNLNSNTSFCTKKNLPELLVSNFEIDLTIEYIKSIELCFKNNIENIKSIVNVFENAQETINKKYNKEEFQHEGIKILDTQRLIKCLSKLDFNNQKDKQEINFDFLNFIRNYYELKFFNFIKESSMNNDNFTSLNHNFTPLPCIKNFIYMKRETYNRRKSILKENAADQEKFSENNIQIQIFYALRCGKFNLVLELLKNIHGENHNLLINAIELMMNNYYDSLPLLQWKSLSQYFDEKIVQSNNSFKIIVYNIIGKCNSHLPDFVQEEVINNVDDYVWIKLSLICKQQFFSENKLHMDFNNSNSFVFKTLNQQTEEICKNSNQNFNSSIIKSPLDYFQILFCSLNFEHAINFLIQFSKYYVFAVHIAVVLNKCKNLKRDFSCDFEICLKSNIEIKQNSSNTTKVNLFYLINHFNNKIFDSKSLISANFENFNEERLLKKFYYIMYLWVRDEPIPSSYNKQFCDSISNQILSNNIFIPQLVYDLNLDQVVIFMKFK